jgi:hypothetical protein
MKLETLFLSCRIFGDNYDFAVLQYNLSKLGEGEIIQNSTPTFPIIQSSTMPTNHDNGDIRLHQLTVVELFHANDYSSYVNRRITSTIEQLCSSQKLRHRPCNDMIAVPFAADESDDISDVIIK